MLDFIDQLWRNKYHKDCDGYQTVLVNPVLSAGKDFSKDITGKIADTGNNTGNLMFSEGIKEQLHFIREVWVAGDWLTDIKKPAVIMPSANFIIHGSDGFIEMCQQFLDNTDCPVTLAGLGAQSSKELDTPKKLVDILTPVKKKYFKAVAERAVSLGIRGEYTAECLELMGIYNYRIIGCPSFYKHLNGVYPVLPDPALDHTQITVTTGTPCETHILEMGMDLNSIWMMQMMTEMPKSAFEGEYVSPVWTKKRFPDLGVDMDKYTRYLRTRSRMYFTLDSWNRFYKDEGITFSFGSRFHGNMASIRNGVPALWITHDSRTTELTRTLHVPCITAEKFLALKHPQEMLEYCDFGEMYANYTKMCQDYVEFLEENHISHRFRIKRKKKTKSFI